jgi:chromosomal replication initiator protein
VGFIPQLILWLILRLSESLRNLESGIEPQTNVYCQGVKVLKNLEASAINFDSHFSSRDVHHHDVHKHCRFFVDKAVWQNIKDNLMVKNAGNRLLETWFDPVELVSSESTDTGKCLKLGVPSGLHQYWISENFLDRIYSEISAVYTGPFKVELVVTGDLADSRPAETVFESSPVSGSSPSSPPNRRDILNPDYTFSSFVVGRNNEFAHAACFSVAEQPGSGVNPLFICGPTGMGKTHLLNAVGNYIREKNPHVRICYLSAERFLHECISGIRRNTMDKFRLRYRERCDILLIDDVQILGRGEAVQDEFFHTLNDFFETKRQVVVASDRMPKDIQGLEDRIRTRLEWGLIADIQMPDLETRMAILRYKAELKSIKVPDEVVHFIARLSKRSIRELEGNLNKVKIFTELQGLPLTLELTRRVLATHGVEQAPLTLEEIQKMTAEHFGVRVNDLKSANRSKPLVTARQVAMYLIKKHLGKSLSDIGRAFGGKDHTTVINALRRIEDQRATNMDLNGDITTLESNIHKSTGL